MIDTIYISVFTCCFSLLLDFCFREGNIFGNWLLWIARHRLGAELYDDLISMKDSQVKKEGFETNRELILGMASKDFFLFKPLGYCVVCMDVWISIATCLILGIGFFDSLFIIVFSNFLVRYFHNKL